MGTICEANSQPLEHVGTVAIGVYHGGTHVGLLYRVTKEAELQFFHQKWHKDWDNGKTGIEKISHWIDPSILPETGNSIVAHALLVWDKNQQRKLPFGLSDPRGFFDNNGNQVLEPGQVGLTCATLLLAIFDLSGLAVLDYDTWHPRPEDREQHRDYLETLRNHTVPRPSNEHLIQFAAEVGKVRYRPLEVAGAFSSPTFPVNFDLARELAQRLIGMINRQQPG